MVVYSVCFLLVLEAAQRIFAASRAVVLGRLQLLPGDGLLQPLPGAHVNLLQFCLCGCSSVGFLMLFVVVVILVVLVVMDVIVTAFVVIAGLFLWLVFACNCLQSWLPHRLPDCQLLKCQLLAHFPTLKLCTLLRWLRLESSSLIWSPFSR